MPLTSDLPGCSSRMANPGLRWLTLVITVSAFWPTTAISSLFGEDSVIRFVGPADRVQPLSTNKAMASNNTLFKWNLTPQDFALPALPAPLSTPLSASLPASLPKVESRFMPRATPPLATSLQKVAHQQPAVSTTELTELLAPDDGSEEVATPVDSALDIARCQQSPTLAQLSTDISLPAGNLPTDIAAQCTSIQSPIIDQRMQLGWAITGHRWSATGLRHRPLYFEEINAERYGYTPSYFMQPVISAGRFFATIAALPYKMAVECPRSCDYTLGHYRPGSCAPRRWQRLPVRITGTAAQVGIVAGMILLFP